MVKLSNSAEMRADIFMKDLFDDVYARHAAIIQIYPWCITILYFQNYPNTFIIHQEEFYKPRFSSLIFSIHLHWFYFIFHVLSSIFFGSTQYQSGRKILCERVC